MPVYACQTERRLSDQFVLKKKKKKNVNAFLDSEKLRVRSK